MGGFFGGGASAVKYTILSDFSGNNLYTGIAVQGSSTSSAVWTIRRTTLNAEGSVTATATKTSGVWTNRLTETYT